MKHLVALIMIAIIGLPAIAAAADPKPGAVCRADRQKFCKDAKTSGVKVRDCLMQHKDEVSDACKAFLDKPKKAKGKGKKAKNGEGAPAQESAPTTQSGTPPAQSETPPPAQSETPPAETPPPAQQ